MVDTTEEPRPSEYEHETTAGREEIAELLNGVVDGVLAGYLRLGTEPDTIAVGFPDEISLEIEVEQEEDTTGLELELEWPAVDAPSTEIPVDKPSGESAEELTPVNAGDGSESVARFEVYHDRAEEWRWRLRHRNGEIIANSGEGYTGKQNARKRLQSVVANSSEAEITEASTD